MSNRIYPDLTKPSDQDLHYFPLCLKRHAYRLTGQNWGGVFSMKGNNMNKNVCENI